jgi:hypothetical protein
VLIGSTSLGFERTNDTAAFLIIGRAITEGSVPYRDLWDVSGIAIFVYHGVVYMIGGTSDVALRAFDASWQLLTALLVGQLAWRLSRSQEARLIAGAAYLALYFSMPFAGWAHTTAPANLFVVGAFYALVEAKERHRSWFWALSGMGLGIAVLFRVPLGLLAVPMGLAAASGPASLRDRTKKLMALAFGGALPIAICFVYLAANGALDDYLIAQFVYGPQYSRLTHETFEIGCAADRFLNQRLAGFYGLLVLPWLTPVVGGRPLQQFLRHWVLWLWLVMALVGVWLGGHFAFYHFYTAFPPAVLLGSIAIAGDEPRRQAASGNWLARGALVAVMALPAAYIIRNAAESTGWTPRPQAENTWKAVAEVIRAGSSPAETMYLWGNQYAAYVYADRRPATRFLGIFNFSPRLTGLPYRDELLADLRRSHPAYIIQTLGTARTQGCIYPIDEDGWLADWPELREFFGTYTVELDTPRYRLLKRPIG